MEVPVAFLDANVLYPAGLRNLFMRLATEELFQAKWSNDVHEEWIRNVLKDRPNITPEMLQRTRRLMDEHIDDCLVHGYEGLLEQLTLPDVDDRHVLAAAITGQAAIIVTFNLRDFPPRTLADYGIEAMHPDKFVCTLIEANVTGVCHAAKNHRNSLQNPPRTVEEYLTSLIRGGLPKAASQLYDYSLTL